MGARGGVTACAGSIPLTPNTHSIPATIPATAAPLRCLNIVNTFSLYLYCAVGVIVLPLPVSALLCADFALATSPAGIPIVCASFDLKRLFLNF